MKKLLWGYLCSQQLGYKFRRQHPIGPYVLDFYCPALRLCLEVDGEQHRQTIEKDKKRDDYLRAKGIVTVRIPSLELWGESNMNVSEWAALIQDVCQARATERKRF